jgi:CheY-like chemotaxis protein
MTKKKILYVDDDEGLRFIVPDIVEEVGEYEVFVAANGEEGLAVALKEKPDVVVTDIDMPIMNGITLAKKLQEKDPYWSIVMVSGDITDERKKIFQEIGINHVVQKPFKIEVLMEAIRQAYLESLRHE